MIFNTNGFQAMTPREILPTMARLTRLSLTTPMTLRLTMRTGMRLRKKWRASARRTPCPEAENTRRSRTSMCKCRKNPHNEARHDWCVNVDIVTTTNHVTSKPKFKKRDKCFEFLKLLLGTWLCIMLVQCTYIQGNNSFCHKLFFVLTPCFASKYTWSYLNFYRKLKYSRGSKNWIKFFSDGGGNISSFI